MYAITDSAHPVQVKSTDLHPDTVEGTTGVEDLPEEVQVGQQTDEAAVRGVGAACRDGLSGAEGGHLPLSHLPCKERIGTAPMEYYKPFV